jgi:DNA-binding NarL/FixJ family response regulator
MTTQVERAIQLLICDDQAIVCEGLRAIFASTVNIQVIGVATNGIDAVELTRTLRPNLVLMDLKMPRKNGIQATKAIREQYPNVRVLVLTTYDDDEWVVDAIRSGAAGYLLKDAPQEDIIKAVVETMKGWNPIAPQVAGKIFARVAQQPAQIVPDQGQITQLRTREREVLKLLALGLSNNDIAQTLFLTDGTVRNYISTIFSKLGVIDRTQAAILAIRAGLVTL